jgi:hypothetical protein
MLCATSALDDSHSPSADTNATVRRSKASTRAPPYSPPITSGSSPASPTRPTEKDDSVSSHTSQAIATTDICWPKPETAWPTQSLR